MFKKPILTGIAPFVIARKEQGAFRFGRQSYRYFYAPYNTTWRHERAVEVPIFTHQLMLAHGSALEIGNVLSHYMPVFHTVVDKYERAPGVINRDVVSLNNFPDKFNYIFSISTFEHIGWDDEGPEELSVNKILEAIRVCRTLLNPGGLLFLSMSLGYNPYLQTYLQSDNCFTEAQSMTFMRKVSNEPRWVQCSRNEALAMKRKVYSTATTYLQFGPL